MGLVRGGAGEAGLSPERLQLVRQRAQEWVAAGDVHRSLVLLVARHGIIAFHEAFGVDGPEPDASPLAVDAIFPLMSQTKPITATMAMMLVEDGVLALGRPVQDYLPEFVGERKDEILVHHLITHTSGIDSEDFFVAAARLVPQMIGASREAPGQHPIESRLLELAYAWPAAHPVGQVMRYANVNYLLLGEIVRRLSSRSLDEFARERIFGPLGMTDSSFGVPSDKAHRVVRRRFDDEPRAAIVHSEIGRGMLGGAGGAYATARDVAAFLQLFLDRGQCDGCQILHPSTVERMTTDQIPGLGAILFGQRLRRASMGLGWIEANSDVTGGWPLLPDGSIVHGGAGIVLPWADPATGVVGVFCSVADRFRTPGVPGTVRHHADLFANVVTTAVTG